MNDKQWKNSRWFKWGKVFCSIVIAAGAVLFVRQSILLYQERKAIEANIAAGAGIGQQAPEESQPVSTPFSGSVDWVEEEWMPDTEELVEQDGQNYVLNPNIRTTLFLGVDKKGAFEGQYIASNGGQSDAIFLLIRDVTTGEANILLIPRDTMTEIRLYDLAGNYVGQGVRHLTLAFAYGTNPVKSCENSVYAVSRLLGGIPINEYMAVTTSALSVINDAVGGVTVTIDDPSLEERDSQMKMGEEITLQGDQAETYLRFRDINQANTAVSRMLRHMDYIQAWIQKARSAAAQNDSFGADLMDGIQDVMVTSMSKNQYLKLGMDVLQSPETFDDSSMIMLPGEAVEGLYYDEYHMDEEAVRDLVIDLFYVPAQE